MRKAESKSQMLSFRLSRREYEQAEETSKAQGYRSVALFARSAVLAFSESPQGALAVQVASLSHRVERLEHEIQLLSGKSGNQDASSESPASEVGIADSHEM